MWNEKLDPSGFARKGNVGTVLPDIERVTTKAAGGGQETSP